MNNPKTTKATMKVTKSTNMTTSMPAKANKAAFIDVIEILNKMHKITYIIL